MMRNAALVVSAAALLVALCGVSRSADAQVGGPAVEWAAPAPNRPSIRVLSETPDGVTLEVTTEWDKTLSEVLERSGGAFDKLALIGAGGQPSITYQLELGSGQLPQIEVLAFDSEELPVSQAQADSLVGFGAAGPEIVNVGEYRRRLVGTLVLPVLRAEDGRLKRTRRMVVRISSPAVQARLASRGAQNPHVAVTRSVLADGEWHRISVAKEGIYRLTPQFLRDSLGVTAAASTIQVFGNGGRILPAVNSTPRPADLHEVPTLISGDALLFYAEGPSWWDWDRSISGGEWRHEISPFADSTHYFIRVNAPSPVRLQPGQFPGWADAERVALIDDRRFFERDAYNHERDGSGSGLDWAGPEMPRSGSAVTVLGDETPVGMTPTTTVRYRARVFARTDFSSPINVVLASGGTDLRTIRPPSVSLDGGNTGNLLSTAEMSAVRVGSGSIAASLRFTGGGNASRAWVDWVEAVIERPALTGTDGYVRFATPGGRAGRFEFALQGFASEPQVWDVTESGSIRRLGVQASAGAFLVQVQADDGDRAREIVAFSADGSHLRLAGGGRRVANQNLHGIGSTPDYVVVSHPNFLEEAQRLADHRQARDGFSTLVVTTDQVYNEFAAGTADMRAVRDFMKFLYDRDPNRTPGYLTLFGDGHFDFRRINSGVGPSYVPPYQTENMISRTSSYTSDDYFGLMGDEEGRWADFSTNEIVDIAIGRIPARTVADARNVVDKIISYDDPSTQGPWRSRFTFVADDQYPNTWDTDVHVLNSNVPADNAQAADPSLTVAKIYAPSYPAVVSARGLRRPQAVDAIIRSINDGTLIWSYSGHGGPEALGDEKYFDQDVLSQLDNEGRLPVFITATCSFGKFDIEKEQSMAEEVLLRQGGGGVAMFTTVRIVYTGTNPGQGDNFGLNIELTNQLVAREPDGRAVRLGDALLRTKNRLGVGNSLNNRKFNLLGDPGMRLGLPDRRIEVEPPPALVAFEEATVTGSVLGLDGLPDTAYAGEIDIDVYDALRVVEMPQTPRPFQPCCNTGGRYTVRTDRIYSGRATVQGGQFSATFRVPQDISYSGAPARVAAYARGTGVSDAGGASLASLISTQVGARPSDSDGPQVRLFVDDTTFVSGGLVRASPTLLAKLRDSSGINTVGAGVGHELLLTLNGDASTAIDIGRFYQGDLNTYRSGTVRYPLRGLSPGTHTAQLTAWDALNNASTVDINFIVSDAQGLEVRNVFPYPNPTVGPTRFTFEHNQPPGTAARAQLRIFTINGRPIRTIDGEESLPGGILAGPLVQIPWDGRDDDLDALATGVYLFRLRVETDGPDGATQVAERVERLAIIR